MHTDDSPSRYLVHGIRIYSELPLPLRDSAPDGPPEVTVVTRDRAALARELQGEQRVAVALSAIAEEPSATLHDCAGGMLLRLRGYGDFLVHNDEPRISVLPEPGVSQRALGHRLVTMPLARVLLDLGYVPLHASTIVVAGRGVALVARSGVGKSTLAAACEAMGATVIGDDMAVLSMGNDDSVHVRVASPVLRLSGASRRGLGGERAYDQLKWPAGAKAYVERRKPDAPSHASLTAGTMHTISRIYLLERESQTRTLAIEAVRAAEAAARLESQVVSASMLRPQERQRVVAEVAHLQSKVGVFVLRLPTGIERVMEHARVLIEHERASARSPQAGTGRGKSPK